MQPHNSGAKTKTSVILRAAYVAIGLLFVIAAFFNNSYRSADFDPQQMRTYVERTIRFGGTFYENGLHNKGPLDPILYRFAFTLGGHEAFWYAISAFIAVGTILIAYAAFKSAAEFRVPTSLGLALSLIAFFHFALAKTDYSGVLYSRNEVSYLLVVAWILILINRVWDSEKNCGRSAVLLGVILGLSVQTVLTTMFAAAAIVFAWISLMTVRTQFRLVRKLFLQFAIAGIVTFASAPLWYLGRGKFDEFWGGWWIYARYQSHATEKSLGEQFGWGWDNITQYYGNWPLSFAIIFASSAMLWVHWRNISHRQKTLYLGGIFWLIGGWIELILSQRYSTHYFVVIAIPTMILASIVVGHLFQWVSETRSFTMHQAFPILAVCACLIYFPNNAVKTGLEQFSNFQGIAKATEKLRVAESGDIRTLRAVLDVVSDDNDALLAWTGWPWTYLNVQRVSASRMIWGSMFVGEIYLAGSGPEWVVPNTWEWFADDMRESNPAAYTERNDFPRREGIPFDDYVNQNMTLKFSGSQEKVWLRNDIASLLSNSSVDPITNVPTSSDFSLGNGWCKGYAFTIEARSENLKLNVNFVTHPENPLAHVIEIQSSDVRSKDHDLVFDQAKISNPAEMHAIQVIVGNRSALLTIDGEIVGAHRLDAQSSPNVTVTIADPILKVSSTRSGEISWPSGCSNS